MRRVTLYWERSVDVNHAGGAAMADPCTLVG